MCQIWCIPIFIKTDKNRVYQILCAKYGVYQIPSSLPKTVYIQILCIPSFVLNAKIGGYQIVCAKYGVYLIRTRLSKTVYTKKGVPKAVYTKFNQDCQKSYMPYIENKKLWIPSYKKYARKRWIANKEHAKSGV